MIVGNPAVFAIESQITEAYEPLGWRALGFFLIHVGGRSYGVRAPDSSLLACAFDGVESRISARGTHIAPFAAEQDASQIAEAIRTAVYIGDESEPQFFGLSLEEISKIATSKKIIWAPDGEEAFDDGSFVFQFDVDERVRLIAFRDDEPSALSDVWIASGDYYRILSEWHDAFELEWAASPKIKE